MISDVLSDAISRIRDYQRKMPDAYRESEREIQIVVTFMDALREYYDLYPSPETEDRAAEIQKQLGQCEVIAQEIRERQGAWHARCAVARLETPNQGKPS